MKYSMTFEFERLADAAAFEELALETGVEFSLTNVKTNGTPETMTPAPVVTPSHKSRRRSTTGKHGPRIRSVRNGRPYYRMTKNDFLAIKKAHKDHPHLNAKQLKEFLQIPYGVSTVGHVLSGRKDKQFAGE